MMQQISRPYRKITLLVVVLVSGLLSSGCSLLFPPTQTSTDDKPPPAQADISTDDETKPAPAAEVAPPPIAAALVKSGNHSRVNVFYATDRKRSGYTHPKWFYGSDRGPLDYGIAEVSIPQDHRIGVLETPNLLQFEFRENPDKHVVLMSIKPFTQTEFVGNLKTKLQSSEQREALIFLHGYNVSFEDAIRRTAQIAYDLEFPGIPVLYSWPSQGAALKYPFDENNARWTVTHFEEFLRLMLTQTGASNVHVIAHSMGNRVLAEALRSCDFERLPADAAKLRQIVFAAPDIDADTFRQLAHQFHDHAERFTLYASSKDRALALSQRIHRYPRAGDFSDDIGLVDGIDTIDASSLVTDFLGHSYYGDNESIISDIYQLLKNRHPPEQRSHLLAKQRGDSRYWVFKP